MNPYDAILIISFGGPEGMDDVLPFLENVLRGRNVPRERTLQVAKHYEMFGGISPINGQNRRLIEALRAELDANGFRLRIYWGNRNWHPMLVDTMQEMANDGVKHALAFVTSAYSSYSSCRQYLEDIASAQAAVGPAAPHVDKLRAFYNHPEFIEANADNIRDAWDLNPAAYHEELVFTAHSIPLSMAVNCDYEAQLKETCRLVAEELSRTKWRLVFQSRSGPPTQPWLEPDVCDHLRDLKQQGTNDVLISPIGFVSDHMEIVYDLDTEARKVCQEIGMNMVRAATAGTHPAFIKMIRELIMERIDPDFLRLFLGQQRPLPNNCREGCCPKGAPGIPSGGKPPFLTTS